MIIRFLAEFLFMKKYLASINSEFVLPAQTAIQSISWGNPTETISKIYRHFMTDSLYRNSIYLMLSTAVQAFFGFFFWTINARLFSPETVGLATTLISVASLISNFSLLGFNTGLVRYLSKSEAKNKTINSIFSLAIITTILMSIIYFFILRDVTPKLTFMSSNIFLSVSFIIFVTFFTLNTISDNIFIAYRSTKYVIVKNSIISILKVLSPLFLVGLGAYGIFTSVYLATAIAFLFGCIILVSKFNYIVKFIIDMKIIRNMTKLSFGNFIANYVGGLPTMLLPILITNRIDSKASAVFYIDMMIANLLFIIPMATTQSLLAEGSYNELEIKSHIKKAIFIISIILIPAVLMTVFFGNYILLVFGKTYSTEGIQLLRFLAIAGIFSAVGYITNALLNIAHRSNTLIVINTVSTVIILGLSYLLLPNGLFGVGLGFLIGQILVSLFQAIIVLKLLKI
jgi:O-antigen/teichoic acid export membrane protein